MDIIENIMEMSGYNYEFIFHEKQIISAMDGAKYFGIEPGQTAPTLIIKTEQGHFSLVFSGSRSHIDFKQIARLLNVNRAALANKKAVKELLVLAPATYL